MNSPAISVPGSRAVRSSRNASRIFAAARHEPLTRKDIEDKFVLNAHHGGWNAGRAKSVLGAAAGFFDGPIKLDQFGE